jgi:hypothetical protein
LYIEDYMDADTAYLAGLIIARGTLIESPARRLLIEFPFSSLEAVGIKKKIRQDQSIKLGLMSIRERIAELLATDIEIRTLTSRIELVANFGRNSMAWRNILLITQNATSYPFFKVPKIFFEPSIPKDWKREFIKGFGDAAGNIRKSNVYVDKRHRVRLDILNYNSNWGLPVELCALLQSELEIPVQMITWGHPNLGREFREHQLNLFADSYLQVGFSFDHKQAILEELAEFNAKLKPGLRVHPCPGKRVLRGKKGKNTDEKNAERLDPRLVGKHFDSYWQICKALGCKRVPPPKADFELEFVDESDGADK